MKKYVRLADFGTALATRENGARVADSIREHFMLLSEKGTLVIDLDGVEAMSYSFTDELVRGLLSLIEYREKQGSKNIALSGFKNDIVDVFNSILIRRNCRLVGASGEGVHNKSDESRLVTIGVNWPQ